MHASKLCALLLVPAILTAQQYFPRGVLGRDAQSDELKINWYSKHLKSLHEPSLWELAQRDPNAEVYRFLWLRSFHHPIVVRVVVKPSGSGWIHSRMTSGKGAYEPGGIRRYSVSWLRKARTREFLAAIESAGFWNLPSQLDANGTAEGPGGAQWILEGVRNGKYHIIDRRSPGAGDPVRAVGILGLKLARFRIRSTEVY